jgi:hypothetical protein
MGWPAVLILERSSDGFYLFRYTATGAFAGDTWHERKEDAEAQALFEYPGLVGEWMEVPDIALDEAVQFALSSKQ